MTLGNSDDRQTHYQRLEISPDEELTETYIRQKFRAAALKLHPDKELLSQSANGSSMTLLLEARDILLDPDKRAAYDKEIFGDPDFVSKVKETLWYAQIELREPPTDKHPAAFYRLKNYCFIQAINFCHNSIQKFGYNSIETKYIRELLEGLDYSFYSGPLHDRCCLEMYLLIATNLIEPIEKKINILRLSPDEVCQIKASQLEYLLGEINEAVLDAHFEGTREIEWGEDNFISYSSAITGKNIYLNLHEKLTNCATKKEINFHRNLIADTAKALTGALVILLTVLPTIGLALFSRTYRNAIRSTFFSTKSRACLENADTALYKSAKSNRVLNIKEIVFK